MQAEAGLARAGSPLRSRPFAVVLALASVLVGWVVADRLGARPATVGFVLVGTGLVLQPLISAAILVRRVPGRRPYAVPAAAALAGIAGALALAWYRRLDDPLILVMCVQFYGVLPVFLLGLTTCSHRDSPGQERFFRGATRVCLGVAIALGMTTLALPVGGWLYGREVASAKAYVEALAPDVEAHRRATGALPDDIGGFSAGIERAAPPLASATRLHLEPDGEGFRIGFECGRFISLERWIHAYPARTWEYWTD